jgi:FkbM family methyltransferase
LKPGETFLDIGANIGIYSLVASKLVGRDGRVIAFEPVENIHNKLTLNKLLNDCDNLELRKTAIGSHIGQAEIYAVKQGIFRQGTSSLVVNENLTAMGLDKFEIQKIDVQSLDYLLSRNLLAAVDFIKIDVEGHEIEVLNGGLELLSKYHPVLLLEHSLPRLEKLGISESRFADFFDSLGYLAFQVNLKHNKLILTPYSFNGKFERNNLFLIHSDNIGKISSIIAS